MNKHPSDEKILAAFKGAVEHAIKAIGTERFKETSFFGSSNQQKGI